MKPKIIICAGAQKAGTRWLWDFFEHHPAVATGLKKEQKFWGDVEPEYLRERFNLVLDTFKKAVNSENPLENIQQKGMRLGETLEQMATFTNYDNAEGYIRYHLGLIGYQKNTHAVDISPAYAAKLTLDDWYDVKDKLSEYFDVKIVYLLRDPIERIISNGLSYEREEPNGVVNVQTVIQKALDEGRAYYQSRYDLAIPRLLTVFGEANVFIETQECFFNPDSIARMCEIIEVDLPPRIDFSPKNQRLPNQCADVPKETMALLREKFRETFDFCEEKYNATHWINFR